MITFYTQAFKKARKNFQEKQNIGNTRFAPLADTAMSSKKNANFLPTANEYEYVEGSKPVYRKKFHGAPRLFNMISEDAKPCICCAPSGCVGGCSCCDRC